jgi:hypothetical protein
VPLLQFLNKLEGVLPPEVKQCGSFTQATAGFAFRCARRVEAAAAGALVEPSAPPPLPSGAASIVTISRAPCQASPRACSMLHRRATTATPPGPSSAHVGCETNRCRWKATAATALNATTCGLTDADTLLAVLVGASKAGPWKCLR